MPEDTFQQEASTAGKTLGDLVSALRQALEHPEDLDLLGGRFWLDYVEQNTDNWAEVMGWPMCEEDVLLLAGPLTRVIAYEVQGRSDPVAYEDSKKRGHAFLRLFHAKAKELGVDIPIEQIDVPLTPTEMMVEAGMVSVVDGRVNLTSEGLAAAQEVQEQIDALKEE